MGKLLEQVLKFGVVGVIATIIDFGVMVLLHELLGIDAVVAAALSFAVALAFNYFASMRYVFTRREDISREREATLFVLLSLVGLAINELIMVAGQFVLEANGLPFQEGFGYVVVKVFATAIVMVWNFLSRKRWLEGH